MLRDHWQADPVTNSIDPVNSSIRTDPRECEWLSLYKGGQGWSHLSTLFTHCSALNHPIKFWGVFYFVHCAGHVTLGQDPIVCGCCVSLTLIF